MLIHKTKPSQADLLLEDAHEKHLVKHLHQPGDAILVTDYEDPSVVSMPFCTREDMETVAGMINTFDTPGEDTLMNTLWTTSFDVAPPEISSSGKQALFKRKTRLAAGGRNPQ